jgi:hypothetical protein
MLLKLFRQARSADYAAGIARLSPRLRTSLARVLRDALDELPQQSLRQTNHS